MNEIEKWKPLPSNENYLVSDLGRVKVLPRITKTGRKEKGKIIKPYLNTGYVRVNIEGKPSQVHQLVAEVFLNHKSRGLEVVVDHINNIKTDNRLVNIQLISQRENSSKDKKGGTSKYIGVYWDKGNKKWRSQIRIKGKLKHLGCFNCELAAAKSYQNALKYINNG